LHPKGNWYMRLLIACLFLSIAAPAQIAAPAEDSSFVKIIDLPRSEPFDTARPWQKYNLPYYYIISDKDFYDLFGYEVTTKFREFDFANYHILGQQKNRQWIWTMRDNEIAFK
jgi:hypothetical protein